jgi:transposase-like protein
MIKDILETALGEELNQHLDLEKLNLGDDFNNRKNGFNSKTVKTKESAFVLNTPRDRNSSFEPQIVKKNQTVLRPFLKTSG